MTDEELFQQRFERDFNRKSRYELCPFLLKDGKKHPFAVICPGGAYHVVCSFIEGEPFAEYLNERGFHAFVVYYRVSEEAAYPAPQEDLARAIREILAHAGEWNLDTENYSVWGSSAGGHLAASFGTKTMGYPKYDLPKPGALVLVYPVITMGELTHPGSRDNLIGTHPTEEMVRLTSVECQVTPDYPRTFVWCGSADSLVPPENSRMLAKVLEANGVEHEFREYPDTDHGTGLGIGMPCGDWADGAIAFWQKKA